ncbi:MAG TPA: SgcJ/EcaC family oxidoreductase [Gemmataceae bacterium]|nr:SgcJ/EcaC family oxidoreductase [Gemmataceae bacterium]
MKRVYALLTVAVVVTAVAAGFMLAQDKPKSRVPNPPADNTTERKDDLAGIEKAMKAFTEAFEKGDADAAAAMLTSGAELIPDSGNAIRGRDAIRKALAEFFPKNPRVKVTLDVESTRFTSKDTAIQEGQIKVVPKEGETTYNRYSILLVREDGKWLLGYIKEHPDETADLRELEWLIGSWTANRADADVRTTYEWFGTDKAFIKAQFTVRTKEKTITGMQMIGEDPVTGELRTWIFENDGGFGEGTITKDGKKWVFESATQLTDGSVLQATNILVQVNKDTFTWQPSNLTVDGEQYGDLPPVKVMRVKPKD